MRVEHLQALRERYPLILERSSIDVGDGWFTLLDCLLEQLQTRARSGLDPQPVAEQIKEKYGELRVYLKVYSDAQDQLIEFAATLSCRTCDVCGSPGELLKNAGWLRTRCAQHEDTRPE